MIDGKEEYRLQEATSIKNILQLLWNLVICVTGYMILLHCIKHALSQFCYKCVIKFFSGLSILISELIPISWFKHLNILKFDLDIKLLSMLINVPVNSNSSFSAIPLCEQHCLQIRAYLLFGPSPTRYSITCKNITPSQCHDKDACNRVSSNMADRSEIMHTWGIKVCFNKINVRGTPQLFSVKDLLGEANIA